MRIGDLGLTTEELRKLCQVYDAVGAPLPKEVATTESEFSWVAALNLGLVASLPTGSRGLEKSQDLSLKTSDVAQTEPTAFTRTLPAEVISRIHDSAEQFRKEEEMEPYLEYIDEGSSYFEEMITDDRVKDNLILDTAQVHGNRVKFDVTCCNSANPGRTKLRTLDGAEKECKYFDPENHLMLEVIVLASMSLFMDIHDSGERSNQQGDMIRQLISEGHNRDELRTELLRAMKLRDRTLQSAGLESAEITFYSGKIRKDDTSVIEYEGVMREEHVKGWNVFEVSIDRKRALEILHSYFVEGDLGKVAIILAASIVGDNTTYHRLFIDCCAIWLVDYLGRNKAGICRSPREGSNTCAACEDAPQCYGMLRPFYTLRENGMCGWEEIRCGMCDVLLSQAAASTTFQSEGGCVFEQLRKLYEIQRDLKYSGVSGGSLGVNLGLAKIGAVLVAGDPLDMNILPIVSEEGIELLKELHRVENGYKTSYIMAVIEKFSGEDFGLKLLVDISGVHQSTYGSIRAKSDEVKAFVKMTKAQPVGKRSAVMRLWYDGMYHLNVSNGGIHVSKFPHREGGIRIASFEIERGPHDQGLDLTALRRLANGKYGPHVLEDIIENHELGNIFMPSSAYTCYVREVNASSATRKREVPRLGYINLKNSQRFATDGRRMWYNVTSDRYVRCKLVKGQWTFFHDRVCEKPKKLLHVVPKGSIWISAKWAH